MKCQRQRFTNTRGCSCDPDPAALKVHGLFCSRQINSRSEEKLHELAETSNLNTFIVPVNALQIFRTQYSTDIIGLNALGAKLG